MKRVTFLAATLACTTLLTAAPYAPAQELLQDPALDPVVAQQEATPEQTDDPDAIPTRESAPNTDTCPNEVAPPQARTTSEVPTNGVTPSALPQEYDGPCGVIAAPGYVVPDNVLASAWLVADADTGEIIAMKDPHGRYRPASIIKVLLALTVIKELPLDRVVTVSEESAAQDGSAVGIGAGGRYTVEQLLYGLLLASGNDAAHALAQELGGDEVTLDKVNQLAQELGTTDTRVTTYSGLDAAGMQTSAWDLGKMYRAAYADPTFTRITNTESIDFPGYGDLEGYELWNDNQLFMNNPDGIGGKTGFTDDANHTFVGALDRGGRRIMAIILDTTVDKGRPWEQAQSLIDEAYQFTNAQAVATLDDETAPATQAEEAVQQTPAPEVPGERDSQAQVASDSSRVIGVLAVAAVAIAAIVAAAVALAKRRATTSSGAGPKHRRR